jgi:DNA processing protein
LLTLLSVRGIGPAIADKIANSFSFIDEAIESAQIKRIGSKQLQETLSRRETLQDAYDQARKIWEQAEDLSVRIVSAYAADYPRTLARISDRPPVIFVKGMLPIEDKFVACIGTREPTEFGKEVSKRIVEFLIEHNWAIVSGLAAGIDAICHETAVRQHGVTIAVMAGGLDSIYPKINTMLAERILDTGGALISEQPFGAPPTPRNLVQRDRIQSGLSFGTVVMQTGIEGGSMHTVRFTLLQGRPLFAPVPFGRHAEEFKSQGLLALTKSSGSQFADRVDAKDDYKSLLKSKFVNRPVALGIAHREEYDELLDQLNDTRQSLTIRSEVPARRSLF